MPHIWNDIAVVTKDELVPEFYNSLNSLTRDISRKKDKPYGIKKVQSGGNGRKMLIDYDTLDAEIRDQLKDPRSFEHILEKLFEFDSEAVRFYSEFTYPNGNYLHSNTKEQYIINASVLGAICQLEEKRRQERISKGGSVHGILKTLHQDCISFNKQLFDQHEVKHNLPSSYRHWSTTYKNFKEKSYICLIKDAEGKTLQNARKVDDSLRKLLNDLFATQPHKPTAAEVAWQYEGFLKSRIEVINQDTGEVYDPDDFVKISKSTITHYLASWESKVGTYAKRSGNAQVLKQKFVPYHSLEPPKYSGSLISIDDRQPPFEYAPGKRVWFYLAIDLASEAIVCWVHGKTKEGLILEFYKQLVRNYHKWGLQLPLGLECEKSLNWSFKDSFLRNGSMFENVRIESNNARGKRIERFFKEIRYKYEKSREGWIARPFALSEANQAGPKAIKEEEAKAQRSNYKSYDQIVKECLQDIVKWNRSAHSKKEISRWDYFLGNQNPKLKPTNYKSFIKEFKQKRMTSCNAGIIKFNNQEWLLGDNGEIKVGAPLIELMKKVEGRTFEVYYLEAKDGSNVKAFIYMQDRYICEILPKPTYSRADAERTPECEMNRVLMSSYVSTIQAFQKENAKSFDRIEVIDYTEHEISKTFSIEEIEEVEYDDPEEIESYEEIEEDPDPPTEENENDSSSWRNQFNY